MTTKPRTPAEVCKALVHLDKYVKRNVDGVPGDETFCNWFVNDVALAIGCPEFDGDPWPLKANVIVKNIDNNPARWQPADPDEAQDSANEGKFVISGWANKEGHGHVNVIIPGKLVWSNQFQAEIPNCANVGSSNFFGKPVSYGYGKHMKPRYWIWLQPKTQGESNGTD